MSVAAVICEYNPFHNGHKHQLDTIKKELNVDYIVCLMSGDFVQRGEPAVFSKESRTEWAVDNGADVVLLLPAVYSTSGADLFALGAVNILSGLGCIDYLCFGSECGNIDLLSECAFALMKNGNINSPAIKELIREGNTFGKARSLLFPEYAHILNSPNNILAFEYISALNQLNSSIKPYTIKREGQEYNSDNYSSSSTFLSASSIRKGLYLNDFEKIRNHIPYNIDSSNIAIVNPDILSKEIFYALLSRKDVLNNYLEVNDDLAKRINNKIMSFDSFSSFVSILKTKNMTHSRISRALIHILLGIKNSEDYFKSNMINLNYVKLLGFKKESEEFFKHQPKNPSVKIISKIPDEYNSFNSFTKEIFDIDLFASTLYDSISGSKIHEYSKKLIIK